jgi:hypothetical protein
VTVVVVVLKQLCFVWVVVEEIVVVVGARREEQAVVMLLGKQVAKSVGVERLAAALRLLILRVVPLFYPREQG